MGIEDKIRELKPYIRLLNVSTEDDAIYALLTLPKGWAIPTVEEFKEMGFVVQTAAKEEGIYIATELKYGMEKLLEAIERTVEYNKLAEERMELLTAKMEELKQLFLSESLDRLRLLEFTFRIPKKQAKKAAAPKPVVKEPLTVAQAEPESQANSITAEQSEALNNDANDMMSFAKEMVGE